MPKDDGGGRLLQIALVEIKADRSSPVGRQKNLRRQDFAERAEHGLMGFTMAGERRAVLRGLKCAASFEGAIHDV